jgi:hypothetical protein
MWHWENDKGDAAEILWIGAVVLGSGCLITAILGFFFERSKTKLIHD